MIEKSAVYAFLILTALIFLFPLFWIVKTSFLPPLGGVESYTIGGLFATEGFTLESYFDVYLQSTYPQYLLNSFIIVLSTVALVTVMGTLAGYALARFPIRGKENFFFFALTTRMGPPVTFALPFFILMTQSGLIDTHIGLTIVYTFANLAFAIWMSRSFFEEVPPDLEEAAMVDGATRLQALRRVVLPVVTPGIIATAIVVFIFAWNEFFYASILTRQFAKTFTVNLPGYFSTRDIRWGSVAAASTVAAIPPIVFAIIARKWIIRGMTFGAVKG
jgi:multiple sugar transport system permease protein